MAYSEAQKNEAMERVAKIYARIRECARHKEPCPTNRDMGKRFLCSVGAVQNALHFLESAGMIRKTNVRPLRFYITADDRETL